MSMTHASPATPILPAVAPLTATLAPFAEPMVRIAAGLILVPHGAQKLFGWFGGYGLEATGQFFAAKLGLPASFALLAGLIEFGGGLLLAAGLATRAAAALVTGLMAVASRRRLFLDERRIRISAVVGHRRAFVRDPRGRPLFGRCADRPRNLKISRLRTQGIGGLHSRRPVHVIRSPPCSPGSRSLAAAGRPGTR
jgi:DoxX